MTMGLEVGGVVAQTAPALQLDTLWILVSATVALLTVPGIVVLYGGRMGGTAVRDIAMAVFGGGTLVVVLWVVYGYGMVFGAPWVPHIVGDPLSNTALQGYVGAKAGVAAQPVAFAGFQALFAVLAVSVVAVSAAGRVRISSWLIFVALWITLGYFPVAYGVFNLRDGWGAGFGLNDFAGAVAVHVSAAAAGLAVFVILRRGRRSGPVAAPRDPPIALGAAMVWIGWFGLTAGSEAAVDGITALSWVNTLVAPAGGVLGSLAVTTIRRGRPSVWSASSGALSGLVAISAGCNVLSPAWAIVLGGIVGVFAALAGGMRVVRGSGRLEMVAIHGVSGVIGTIFIGIFASRIGFVATGSFSQLIVQVGAACAVMLYSFAVAWIIGVAVVRTIGLRDAAPTESRMTRGHDERDDVIS